MVLVKLILRCWVNCKANTALLAQSLPDDKTNSNSDGRGVVNIILIITLLYLT